MEEGRARDEGGRAREGSGEESAEDQVGESHSETFRLKQCQHIPIIPVHSLSLPLSHSLSFHPLSPLRSFTSRFVAVLLGSRCGCEGGKALTC